MRAVAIVGSSGAGKTTLARTLSARLDLEHVELDGIFHQPGWTPLEIDRFRAEVRRRLDGASSGWVSDGNYNDQLDGFTQRRADTIVWLDLPKRVIMRRVMLRTVRRAATREELWNGNTEPITNFTSWDPEKNIARWAWVHYDRYRADFTARSFDGTWAHAEVVHLRTQREVDRWVTTLTG